ncbi:hypothetical protein BCIN_10g03070 [Botrytis cinerea B05.10]|uniref:Uncharacterized protein n=1 Tax=Botryotinia fuckeliana (strain B05.10) TaxID=332648 RepID=A0A384JUL9_BOTFB|nr:hypothetical protein BCIN_10g03070 [Botrytis cinerea B05.10]ATZ54296.1 hypothetical protein BCIN_10g03070 [Botrytis cinerea B05.10]
MDFQAYRDNASMQRPILKLKHHSIFSWEEGSIEQRGLTNEEIWGHRARSYVALI